MLLAAALAGGGGGSPALPTQPGSTQDGRPVGCHQPARGGVIGARQVVEVPPVLVLALPAPCHLLVLLPPHDLALVGDGLHVVLVLVAGLVQRVLGGEGGWAGALGPRPRAPRGGLLGQPVGRAHRLQTWAPAHQRAVGVCSYGPWGGCVPPTVKLPPLSQGAMEAREGPCVVSCEARWWPWAGRPRGVGDGEGVFTNETTPPVLAAYPPPPTRSPFPQAPCMPPTCPGPPSGCPVAQSSQAPHLPQGPPQAPHLP